MIQVEKGRVSSQKPCRGMVLLSCFSTPYIVLSGICMDHKPLSPTGSALSRNDLSPFAWSTVEPQISHFVNITPCEELVPKRNFWQV